MAFDAFTTDAAARERQVRVADRPKKVFGFQNVAPVVKQSVLGQEGPAFAQTLNKVSVAADAAGDPSR